MNYSRSVCIHSSVHFPAGVAMGASSSLNLTEVDRDGQGNLVLRGTALAGVIRHRYKELYGASETDDLFGQALDSRRDESRTSRILFFDSILDEGTGPEVQPRMHNSIDRHRGRVLSNALFSLECCPPGTRSSLMIEIHGEPNDVLDTYSSRIAGILRDGLILGGNSNRGIGFMEVTGDILFRMFELDDSDQYAEYLDFRRQWKLGNSQLEWIPVPAEDTRCNDLNIRVDFRIPEGQDILISDGTGTMDPQSIIASDGKEYWRLPGSSLRGLMRSYIEHSAAKKGLKIAYTLDVMRKHSEDDVSAQIGWLFEKPGEGAKRKPELHELFPVASLFGSLHAAGRLHITDAFIPKEPDGSQERMHVSIDSISGGAIEGLFFSNSVITSACCSGDLAFSTRIILRAPQEHEIEWIVDALKAIDSGYLRVGSSKASGRLCIFRDPVAWGKMSEEFISAWKDKSNG